MSACRCKPDFSLDTDRVVAAIAEHQPALVFIAYPNNPTGNLFDESGMMRILEAAPGVVVVDEAYHAFAGKSFMPRLADHSNLLVMRTVSKSGLAGLRLGLIAGNRAWLTHVDKVRLPYNVNVLTQIVAEKALQHHDLLERQAAAIRTERTRLFDELGHVAEFRRIRALPISYCSGRQGRSGCSNGLRQRGVLIKNLDGSHPALADCLRVTVGMPEEDTRFLAALKETVNR